MNSQNHTTTLPRDAKGMARILQTELTSSSKLFRRISNDLKTSEGVLNGNAQQNRSYSQPSRLPTNNVPPTLLLPPPQPNKAARMQPDLSNATENWAQFDSFTPVVTQAQKPIDNGACDMKRLQEEMATLRKELAAMSDIMKEDDEWLQRSSAEVKELAREQKKFENLTSQQFPGLINGIQKGLSPSINGYQVKPPPLPKSPRPNLNPIIEGSTTKKLPPPLQKSTSLVYENGSVESSYRRGLPPTSPKPCKTMIPVQKLISETQPVPESQLKFDSPEISRKSVNVKRMSSMFESRPHQSTAQNVMQNRRKSDLVSEFRTKKCVPESDLTIPPLIKTVDKLETLPTPTPLKLNHNNSLKNGFVTRERPPLSPKPAMDKSTQVKVNGVSSTKAPISSVLVRSITMDPPNPCSSSLPPPPPPLPSLPQTTTEIISVIPQSISKDDKAQEQDNTKKGTNPLLEEIQQFKKPRPTLLENLETHLTSKQESTLSLESNSPVLSPLSPTNSTKGTFELLQEIRQFKTSGHSLRKVSDESADSTPQRRRKNSMHDALQTRFQAFCGIGSDSSSEDEIDEDYQWDE